MAMILYNPTNEDMETQYIGERVSIKSGAKVRVDDPRGRHVLNTLGPRGLVTLEYGDEGEGEEKKKQQGIERNMAFKRKQVIDFNTMNEQRFQSRLAYLTPTKQVQEYAKEIGVELRQPYNVESEASKEMAEMKKQLAEQKEEVAKKDDDIKSLTDQVNELISLNKRLLKMSGQDVEDREDGINVDFRKLSEKNMADWLFKNWNLVQDSPKDVQDRVAKRYETVYKETMPASIEELQKKVEKLAA